MSDLKGAGFGLTQPKKEGESMVFDHDRLEQDQSGREPTTWVEVKVPLRLEKEVWEAIATILVKDRDK